MTTNRVPTIFVGGLAHETHSFSNARTPIPAFEAYEWADADRLIEAYRGTKTSVGGVIDGADQVGNVFAFVVRGQHHRDVAYGIGHI